MKQGSDAVGRIRAVVDYALRESFPANYWKRCTYAAFGLNQLLTQRGIACEFVSGEVLCFTLSPDGNRAQLEGYGNAVGGTPSHYWIEADGALLDLGVHYLPKEARRPIVAMPVVRWAKREPLPRYLRYREMGRAPAMRPDSSIVGRVEDFLGRCEIVDRDLGDGLTAPAWALTGPDTLRAATQRSDTWARGAARFETWVDPRKLPF